METRTLPYIACPLLCTYIFWCSEPCLALTPLSQGIYSSPESFVDFQNAKLLARTLALWTIHSSFFGSIISISLFIFKCFFVLVIIMERRGGQYSVTNCRNVGAMLGCRCDVSAFILRRSMCRPSKIDDRCVDLRRSMCRLSKIDVPTFEDRWRCVDLRRPMIDVKLCCHTCSKH